MLGLGKRKRDKEEIQATKAESEQEETPKKRAKVATKTKAATKKAAPKSPTRRSRASAKEHLPAAASASNSRKMPPAAKSSAAMTPPRQAPPSNRKASAGNPLFSPKPAAKRNGGATASAATSNGVAEEDNKNEVPVPLMAVGKPSAQPAPDSEDDHEGEENEDDSDLVFYDDSDEETETEAILRKEGALEDLEELHHEPSVVDQTPPKKTSAGARVFLVLFALFFSGWVMGFDKPEAITNNIQSILEPSDPKFVCFHDSTLGDDVDVPVIAACLDTNTTETTAVVWQDCPPYGRCEGGSLLKCLDGFDIADQGCFPSASSNESLEALVVLLQEWTAVDVCRGHPERKEALGYGNRPLFHFSRVTGELELGYNLPLVKHANHSRFLLEASGDGNVWIALHPDVHVPISLLCSTKMCLFGLCTLLLGGLKTTVFAYWEALTEEPYLVGFLSIAFLGIGYVVRSRQTKQAKYRLLQKDLHACRELIIDLLSADPATSLSTNCLSEKTKWALYPGEARSRVRISKVVMPRLSNELKTDTRIRRTHQVKDGLKQEHWQWTAAPPSNSGARVHFAPNGGE